MGYGFEAMREINIVKLSDHEIVLKCGIAQGIPFVKLDELLALPDISRFKMMDWKQHQTSVTKQEVKSLDVLKILSKMR